MILSAAGPLMRGEVPLGEVIAFWILGPISLAGRYVSATAKTLAGQGIESLITGPIRFAEIEAP